MAQPEQPSREYPPFRARIIHMVISIVLILAILILPLEFYYRRLGEVESLNEDAVFLLSGVRASFSLADLDALNRFTRERLPRIAAIPKDDEAYYGIAFNMLVSEGHLLTENEVGPRLDRTKLPDFRYAKLEQAAHFWEQEFSTSPGIQVIFARYKLKLATAVDNAREAGFHLSDTYIMLDSGKQTGFFRDHIVFLLDGWSWWEHSTYPGMQYLTQGLEYWRADALAGKHGYGHKPLP